MTNRPIVTTIYLMSLEALKGPHEQIKGYHQLVDIHPGKAPTVVDEKYTVGTSRLHGNHLLFEVASDSPIQVLTEPDALTGQIPPIEPHVVDGKIVSTVELNPNTLNTVYIGNDYKFTYLSTDKFKTQFSVHSSSMPQLKPVGA